MPMLLLHITHGSGAVEVAVPDDQPLAQLMPHVLEAARVTAGAPDVWRLASLRGVPIEAGLTLAAAAVPSGATLRLVPASAEAAATATQAGAWRTPQDMAAQLAHNGTAPPVQPAPLGPGGELAAGRPNSTPPPGAEPPTAPVAAPPFPIQRTQAILPRRLSRVARFRLAVSAFVGQTEEAVVPGRDLDDAPSPAALTRPKHPGPMRRARRTWEATDYTGTLDDIIAGPRLHSCATIAVMSPKGGVGKTTVTTLLGTLFAQARRDRIVAIDTNPDYGSLGRTLAPHHNVFVDDLLEVLDHPALTMTKLDTSLARAQHGLLVLPAPTAPDRMAMLDEAAYKRVIDRLKWLAGIIVLDCGTGLWEPAARAALAAADQIILVSDAEPATASLVAEASNQIYPANVPVTLVVNKLGPGARLDVERFAGAIGWAQALVTIADEPSAARSISTGEFDWRNAPTSWRISARELAAVIASDWQRLGFTD